MADARRRAPMVPGRWTLTMGLLVLLWWLFVWEGGEPGPPSQDAGDAAREPAAPTATTPVRPLDPLPARRSKAPDAAPRTPSVPTGEPGPTRAEVEAFLRGAVETHLPSHKLPSEAYERLAESVLRVRALRAQIAQLPPTAENAERLDRLRVELVESLSVFDQVLGMDAVEFTRRVQPEVGVTPQDDDEPPPPAEYLEDLPPRD